MKRILKVFTAALLILCFAVPAFAANSVYVIDDADLLTAYEHNQLQNKLKQISDEVDADIVVMTVNGTGGQYIRDFADDYYDYNGYREDGVILVVDMIAEEYWISTSGSAIGDVSVSQLEDAFLADLSGGDYYSAFCAYADACEDALEGLPLAVKLLICLGIGLAVGLTTVMVMKGKLKTVRSQSGADGYMRYDDLVVSRRSDIFLYQTVTRRAKPQNNGGGGIHTGSSGRSHGGGGGRF